MRRMRPVAMFLVVLCSMLTGAAPQRSVYDVRDFGAGGGGEVLCTEAIQGAVDRCAADGGGTVLLPAGTWLTGTVYLRSGVTLQLETGCTLLGSKEKKDYGRPDGLTGGGQAFGYWAILAGKGFEHVAIRC